MKSLIPGCLVSAILLICSFCVVDGSISCMDSNNKPVDWFIMYKLPKDTDIQDGYGYYYMDVNNPEWTLGKSAVIEKDQPLAYTLQQVYDQKDSMHIMYNDEIPNEGMTKSSEEYGHTKGVLASDSSTGFWLIHSVPKYPNSSKSGSSGYSYPHSGQRNGQSILCVTFPYSQMNDIGILFEYNRPQIYDGWATNAFKMDNPDLQKVIDSGYHTMGTGPFTNMTQLTSVQGEKFTVFAKSGYWRKELYVDWVAPFFKSDLATETWLLGTGKLGTNCSVPYKVYDNEMIKFSDSISFKSSVDHSKWAITVNNTATRVVCIGDINREHGQLIRGGGTVCMEHSGVYQAFSSIIARWQKCSSAKDNLFYRNSIGVDIL